MQPHTTNLHLQATQFQGAIPAGRRARRNPTTFIGKVGFGDPPCKSQSSKEWGTLKKKKVCFNPPKGNPDQEQHHSTTHSTDIYHHLCTYSSQIHREVITKKRKLKKIIHICKVTNQPQNNVFEEKKDASEKKVLNIQVLQKPNPRTLQQRCFSFKH